MAEKITIKASQKAINILGKTPDAIAAALKKKRVRGCPGDPNECVLANYFRREFKAELREFVKANDEDVDMYNAVDVTPMKIVINGIHFKPSVPVKSFIKLFDTGAFPALVYSSIRHTKEEN